MIYPKSHRAKRNKIYFQTKKKIFVVTLTSMDQKPKIVVTETPHHHKLLMRHDMKYSSCPLII